MTCAALRTHLSTNRAAMQRARSVVLSESDLDFSVLAKRIVAVQRAASSRRECEPCSLMLWPQAILPRQRLCFRVGPPFTELIEESITSNSTIVMVGSNTRRTTLLSHAVEVQIVQFEAKRDGTAAVEVVGQRRCELVELLEDHSLQVLRARTAHLCICFRYCTAATAEDVSA